MAKAIKTLSKAELKDAKNNLKAALADKAIDALEAVLVDTEAPRSVKVRAAGLVLDQLLQLRELRNTEARLAALEAALYAKPEH